MLDFDSGNSRNANYQTYIALRLRRNNAKEQDYHDEVDDAQVARAYYVLLVERYRHRLCNLRYGLCFLV